MDIGQIKALVKQGESHTLEFKKSTTQLKAVFETLCGFLNGHGGTVLIGVNDSGMIIGQKVTDNTKKEIAREIAKIEPPVNVLVNYIPVNDGKAVIVLTAEPSPFAPHAFDCRPFKRNQSTTSKMPQHQYEQLMVKRGHINHFWDEQLAAGYGIEDLDHEEIRRTVLQGANANRFSHQALGESIPDILNRLKLLTNEGLLKKAALALFAKDVEGDYPQFHIKMARFNGLTKTGSFIDNQSFYGNAFRILERANEFVRRHLPIASFYQENSLERIDKPALPVFAVREALINAISHRDYSKRNSSIALAIYDDRLEIWNPGKLPAELTIADLARTHGSIPRNDLVSKVFYIRNLIEKWGTGTNKMIDLCREQDLPSPEFTEYSGGFSVTFKFKESIGPGHIFKPLEGPLTPRQKEIVEILKTEGPMNINSIVDQLKKHIPERTLRHELSSLKKLGILKTIGSARNTLWGIDLSAKENI
ncbi:MAG: putative DNA binding domain-containing protein [Alphaproteobacteria bacterium]|nr:putative DNA binding domain-containing protein [Alphaproteobacteria bacterium]